MSASESGDSTSLEKGLTLLNVLATTEGGMAVAELAHATGFNRTTTYRLCDVLARAGWIQRIPDGPTGGRRRVDLGPRALGFGVLSMNKYDPGTRLQQTMDSLAQIVGETVHAGVLDGRDVIHIARAVPDSGPHMAMRIGAREAAHVTALGKALLATLSRDETLQLYREEQLPVRSANALTARSELLDELDRVRARGYAFDNEESRTGVFCIGAPIFGPAESATFALSITALPLHVTGERLDAVVRALVDATATATAVLGGRRPADWAPQDVAATGR
jgi:IclR family acetate operon transcriptional repressor